MTNVLHRVFSASPARRRRQRPTIAVAAAVLLWWGYLVLGPDLPWLLAAIGMSVIAVWVMRWHRDVALCAVIAAVTTAAPAVTCMILIDHQVSGASDIIAVLTGYILVAPVPALVACTLRPTLVARPVSTLLGSGVLLLAASTAVLLGGDHGEGAPILIAALTTAVALIWARHRRAAATLLAALPQLNGWTDLGRRTLPDGTQIDQLLIGNGHAIACSTSTTTAIHKASTTAVHRAAATAAALGLAGSRVQPVVLTEQQKTATERHLVNDGQVAASVIVTTADHLDHVIRMAPHRTEGHRRAVLTAAVLPAPLQTTEAR